MTGRRVRRLLPRGGLLKQFSSLTLANVMVAVTSFVTTLILARTVGAETFGQVVFAQSVALIVFVVCDPRLEEALLRYAPIIDREHGAGAASGLFRKLFGLDALIAVASLAVFVTLALVVPSGGLDAYRSDFFILALLQLAAQAPFGTVSAAFGVTDGYARFGLLDLTRTVLTTVASLVALAVFGVAAYLATAAACTLLATVLIGRMAGRRMRARFGRESGPAPPMPAGLTGFALKSSAASSLATGTDSIPMTILGALAGPTALGVFRVAASAGRLAYTATTPIASIMYPRFTRDSAAGKPAAARAAALRWTKLSTPVLLLGAGVGVVVLPPVVRAVFGSEYAAAGTPAVLLLAAALVRSTVIWSKVLAPAMGRPGFRMWVLAGESVALCAATSVLARDGLEAVAGAYLAVGVASVAVWLLSVRPLTRAAPEPSAA